MRNWTIDILRQGGVDWWTWVCLAAALVLICYAAFGKLWRSLTGWIALGLIAVGVCGTALVLAIPALRSPYVGIVWTFILLGILSAVFYLNLRQQLGTRRMAILLTLRTAALAMLAPMLFGPVYRSWGGPAEAGPKKHLIFLVDVSASMSVPDVQNGPTRIQQIWQTLHPQLPKLNEHFIPKAYTFATDVTPLKQIDDLATVPADGQATDIVKGISKVLADSASGDADIILFSDGQDNVTPNVIESVRQSSKAINAILVGSEQAQPAAMANVAVDSLACDDNWAVGHETKIAATIKSSALPNRLVDVKMAEVDANGNPLSAMQIQKLVLQPVGGGQNVVFSYTPPTSGVHRVAVWIDAIPGERTTADNRQEVQGLALDPRIKVLYIEGRLRPEFKYLNRALGHDPNIEEGTLLRLRQNNFAAADLSGGKELQRLPETLEEWKKWDVIILGDLDGSFLSRGQQAGIQQSVADGAGLLMIGGQNNFGPGGYKDTPLEQALPVMVGDAGSPQEQSEFVPQLTVEGLGHPALEGMTDWLIGTDGKKPPKAVPPLRGNVVVGKAKTGAQVLLTHPLRNGPDGNPQIVLAVERYGKGRSAAFTADTTYLWYMDLRQAGQDSPYNRLWGQLVRWLAGADVRNRKNGPGIDGLLNKTIFQFGETVKVRAMVRDDKGDATQYAEVQMKLRAPEGGESRDMPLRPVDGRVGMYEARLPDPENGLADLGKGDYSLQLLATKDGKKLGQQELKFSVIPPADEMLKIAANPDLMKAIAEQTHGPDRTSGYYRPLDGLPAMLDDLVRRQPAKLTAPEKNVPLTSTVRAVLAAAGDNPDWPEKYDLPLQSFLVISILAAEWILRRRWQLP